MEREKESIKHPKSKKSPGKKNTTARSTHASKRRTAVGSRDLSPEEQARSIEDLRTRGIDLVMQSEELRAIRAEHTGRKRAEEALLRSEASLKQAGQMAGLGAWDLEISNFEDLNANPLSWSDQVYRIFGYEPGEVVVTNDLFFQRVHPDDRQKIIDAVSQAIALKQPYSIEHRIIRPDGVERVVLEHAEIMFDDRGRPVRITGAVQDVTGRKRIEESLRASEERYRSYVEVTGQLGWTTNAEGAVVEDLPAWRVYTGQTFDEIKGMGWLNALHPDDREEAARKWEKAVAEKSSYEAECRFRRHDGVYRYFLDRGIPVFREDGSIREWVGTCTDITDRKQAEEALRRANEDLEARVRERTARLLEQTRILEAFFRNTQTCLVFLDRDFNFIRVNEAYARACSRPISDFIGRNHFVDYPSDELKARFQQVIDSGKPYAVFGRPFVFPDHPERGTTYWDLSVAPITGVDGNVELLIFSLVNVTERKGTEEANLRLAAAVESAADGVVITDGARGMIQYVNGAFEQITGWSRDEVLGRTLHLLDSGRHDERFYADLRESLRRDGVWRGRLISRKKDGTLYHEDTTLAMARDAEGKIVNYVSVKRDVTERLRLESIAEAVNTMDSIGYIFAGLRHEIGNPINSAKSILSVLRHKVDTASPERVGNYVDRALTEIGRVETLLQHFRNFNLYETPRIQKLDAASFLGKLRDLLGEDFASKGIALSLQIGPGAEWITADPRALHQVLLNVITNAVDAVEGRPDPRIDITAIAPAGQTVIRVADNGRGMTAEQQQSLFKPFYTTKPRGTGIGLMISRKMMAKMNGTIEITSVPDQGTTVDISLQEVTHGS